MPTTATVLSGFSIPHKLHLYFFPYSGQLVNQSASDLQIIHVQRHAIGRQVGENTFEMQMPMNNVDYIVSVLAHNTSGTNIIVTYCAGLK